MTQYHQDQRHILILGSTGSIGTQTLDIVRLHPEKVRISGLTAGKNWKLLAEQIREFSPDFAVLCDDTCKKEFLEMVGETRTELLFGIEYIASVVSEPRIDLVINSLVGFSGFVPTYNALKSGKLVALANKESLVVGGALLRDYLGFEQPRLFPIDSEHSAILQCLVGEPWKSVEKIIITASGGPFRNHTMQQLQQVTVESALRHPNWSMGAKITIDSSTLMNKGLEVMEAYWLFGLTLDKIEAVIHPQSIIHSMVTFSDGSTKAQLGIPDMRVPIQYALTYPDRWTYDAPRIDWTASHQWTFEPIDHQRFPCYKLALESLASGEFAPAVLNAANEVAVSRFLNKEIPYIGISKVVSEALNAIQPRELFQVSTIIEVDTMTRKFAHNLKL
jgi:1-deoxy-D-xylulose-5-phosphate reductoisomerase